MSQQGQWQVAGSAPEIYERELVPAVFGVWAPILVELAPPRPERMRSRCRVRDRCRGAHRRNARRSKWDCGWD